MRLLVTGASGSGATTLGRALAEKWGAKFFDVDDYFWLPSEPPYQQQRDTASRLSLLVMDMASAPLSVVAGSVIHWGSELEDSFLSIVFLVLPRELRLSRLRAREKARFGQADPKFLEWAAQYDEGDSDLNSRAGDERWLTQRTCPVVRIEGDVSVAERVARVADAFSRGTMDRGDPASEASPATRAR